MRRRAQVVTRRAEEPQVSASTRKRHDQQGIRGGGSGLGADGIEQHEAVRGAVGIVTASAHERVTRRVAHLGSQEGADRRACAMETGRPGGCYVDGVGHPTGSERRCHPAGCVRTRRQGASVALETEGIPDSRGPPRRGWVEGVDARRRRRGGVRLVAVAAGKPRPGCSRIGGEQVVARVGAGAGQTRCDVGLGILDRARAMAALDSGRLPSRGRAQPHATSARRGSSDRRPSYRSAARRRRCCGPIPRKPRRSPRGLEPAVEP